MTEPAKIMQIGEQTAANQQEKPRENGKNRLEGESQLWFNRYCLYRDLGQKRSLRAAVAKERESVRLVKEPQKVPETPTKKRRGVSKPAPVAPPKVTHVPGSWKAACKTYRWLERAKAFDNWLIATTAEYTVKQLADSYANKFKRVVILDGLIRGAIKQMEGSLKEGAGLTHATYLAYIKRIQALMAQLQSEMQGVEDVVMQSSIEAWCRSQMDEIEQSYHTGGTHLAVRKY